MNCYQIKVKNQPTPLMIEARNPIDAIKYLYTDKSIEVVPWVERQKANVQTMLINGNRTKIGFYRVYNK